jgi:phage-related protein
VTFYADAHGNKPVAEYLKALDGAERERLTAALYRIHRFGLKESGVTVRPIEGKLWEIKVSAQRAFYCVVMAGEIVVLHTYYKKTQKAPASEIELATKRMKEVLE